MFFNGNKIENLHFTGYKGQMRKICTHISLCHIHSKKYGRRKEKFQTKLNQHSPA